MIKPEEKGFPVWIMNRIKDYRSFENGQVISSVLEEYIREDIDRLIKTKYFLNKKDRIEEKGILEV